MQIATRQTLRTGQAAPLRAVPLTICNLWLFVANERALAASNMTGALKKAGAKAGFLQIVVRQAYWA
ncbi:MAG: hypothetical protein R3D65_08570 [Zhengella sp.]|uniref:hypothetical protein n=1 Tax=Zhengella sp. TaxID=2282762 RepID=UPI003528F3E1